MVLRASRPFFPASVVKVFKDPVKIDYRYYDARKILPRRTSLKMLVLSFHAFPSNLRFGIQFSHSSAIYFKERRHFYG
jgi:hypothetical protein